MPSFLKHHNSWFPLLVPPYFSHLCSECPSAQPSGLFPILTLLVMSSSSTALKFTYGLMAPQFISLTWISLLSSKLIPNCLPDISTWISYRRFNLMFQTELLSSLFTTGVRHRHQICFFTVFSILVDHKFIFLVQAPNPRDISREVSKRVGSPEQLNETSLSINEARCWCFIALWTSSPSMWPNCLWLLPQLFYPKDKPESWLFSFSYQLHAILWEKLIGSTFPLYRDPVTPYHFPILCP